MKNYLKFTSLAGIAFASLLAISSCSDKIEEEITSSTPNTIPVEVSDKLQALGICSNDIERQGDNYLVEGDIVMTPEALAEMTDMVSVPGPAGEEQYRTCNLVHCRGTRTIRIRSYITSGVRSTGIDYAINNWNAISTCFAFTRVYSGSADIIIYSFPGAGGSAGFPSGGNPYPYVYMGTELSSTQTSEHVATHEIGHCFGLRHSDYFDRSFSCGEGGNEGYGGNCAIHVPRTPSSFDPYSIMNACYSTSTDGEFSYYDKIAIGYLY